MKKIKGTLSVSSPTDGRIFFFFVNSTSPIAKLTNHVVFVFTYTQENSDFHAVSDHVRPSDCPFAWRFQVVYESVSLRQNRPGWADLTESAWFWSCHHVGGGHGSGHQGGRGGKRGGGQVEHDPALLQGCLHQGLQEDHRSGLPGEADCVRDLDKWLKWHS